MSHKKTAVLLFAVVFPFCVGTLAAAQAQTPSPGASSVLAGTPESFLASCRSDLVETKKQIVEIKATKSPRDAISTLQSFDTTILIASDAAARSGLAEQVHPAKPFRDAAQVCEQEASQLLTDISLDKDMYNVLAAFDGSKLDSAASYFLRTTLRDYHRSGVDRDDATRAKIRQIQDELVKIGQEFEQNIPADVRKLQLDGSQLDGLPEDFRQAHKPDASGKVTLKTDNTDYIPFREYATNDAAQKAFYELYTHRAYPKNLEVLSRLLQKRYELAKVLGYPDWAAYITEDKMVETKQNAADFIEKITAASQAGSQRDYDQLLAYRRRHEPNATTVDIWNYHHFLHEATIEKYGYDSQSVRPYFEYSRVLQGILDLTSHMYGITYKRVTTAQVWHPDVAVYDVFDGGKLLGRIYFDMFPRENKYKHYATFNLATGKEGFRLPEYVLVCNFPQASDGPGLMERNDVITFFHEYGHLLHGIFRGNAKWATGDLENDFIEAPSQMFEEWAKDPAILQTFARHYKTNEPIPAELAKKAEAADEFGRALGVRMQMFYAAISLNFYNRDPQGLDTTKLMAELQERYTPFKYVPDTHMQTAFDHLNGYSAVYYTYMWSLVIAKDMFTDFKKDGLTSPAIARKYRDSVLGASGTKSAAGLVSDFLGRPYSFKAYEEWLNGN
ncbi:MAG TPA: M3 family metallopeptidase [Terriglobales bacterium]|nr:M3 family metallopeptidase [Terriglobales bacterium]